MSLQNLTRLCIAATVLGLVVVALGAYVRLSHAGLSCPDWPGCYGQIVVPQQPDEVAQANSAFPQRPVDVARAWKEMAHRYLAGALGLVIAAITFSAWRRRARPGQQVGLPSAVLALVVVQALLGMWTVTLLLKPAVVTAHLLGGITTTALLWWLALRPGGLFTGYSRPLLSAGTGRLVPWVLLGLVLLYLQIFLGGWVSTNYAALACPDFPLCQGQLLPPLDLASALRPWHGLGIDYEGGILATEARVTIHVLHRMGALVVLLYLGVLGWRLVRGGHDRRLKTAGAALVVVLLAQVGLGVANVVLGLPLWVAVSHNAVAALLLLTLVTVYHVVRPARRVI
jgi:cytochrome c oxidase assembly protein subunit 15